MKYFLYFLSIGLISCSTPSPHRQEEISEDNQQEVISAIESGVYSSFQEAISNKNLSNASELHNYLASKCSRPLELVNEEMALSLIKHGVRPVERNYREYKAPLKTTLERGCAPLLSVYLNNMSAEEIAQTSLMMRATDFVAFVNQTIDREPSAQELTRMEEAPFTVDLAVQKNSELCLNNDENCLARDHLLNELRSMREAVAKFAYFKACSVRIEIFNTLQSMSEQVEFARETGVASPVTYDEHVGHAQELRGWYHYYDTLFFKMTGESADLTQCYL